MKVKKIFFVILNIFIILSFYTFFLKKYEPEKEKNYLQLLFVGDVMGHSPQIKSAYDPATGQYDYNPCFKYIKPYIEKADLAIANLEVTLGGAPYSGYPLFSSPDALASGLKNSGFDILLTANNHCIDRGKKGLERTIDVLDTLEILHTGTFKDKKERDANYPLILKKNNFKIALLNCTYGTNGLTVKEPNVVNLIDTLQIKEDLTKLDSVDLDFKIMTIHWGYEYQRQESEEQQKIEKFLFLNGVDAVIGSHPHVIQPIKIYREQEDLSKVTTYSLGNFISNQRDRYKDGGLIFELVLEKSSKTKILDCSYTPVWGHKKWTKEKVSFTLVPTAAYEKNNKIFDLSNIEEFKLRQFSEDTKAHLGKMKENPFFHHHDF